MNRLKVFRAEILLEISESPDESTGATETNVEIAKVSELLK